MADFAKDMSAPDPVAQFRSRSKAQSSRKQPALSRRERYVLWTSLLVIVVSPWHAGSMLWWSNILNVTLAVLPVIVAFIIPLNEETAEQTAAYSCKRNLKNLLKFPVFWLGLLFIGYILIQALNYSWEFVWTENKRGFYMQQLADDQYIHWLPSGMQSPFKITSPWQALLAGLTPWFLVCAMWSTFKRRKAWCTVLWTIAIVGALIAILGVACRITAPNTILWIWDKNTSGPFGPFTYRNQASVYLYMAIACCIALYFYYQRTQNVDSGIQLLAVLLGIISFGGSAMSTSRAGWITTGLVVLAGVGLLCIRILWERDKNIKILALQAVVILTLLSSLGYFLSQQSFSNIIPRWKVLMDQFQGGKKDESLALRQAVAAQALNMFADNKWTGWGANSFRFYFPVYQQNDERLIKAKRGAWRGKRFFWTNAHSDWAQGLAEYGIIGVGILVCGLLYWLGSMLWRIRSLHCEHWILIFAVLLVLSQAVLDIIFYNPSLVLLFAVILCTARGLVRTGPAQ